MVDRGVLIKAMKKRGIREGLVERVEEIMRETKSKIRAGESIKENFFQGSETRMSAEFTALQHNDGGLGGEDGKGQVGRSQAGG